MPAEFLRKPSASTESTAEVAVRELQQRRQGVCNSRLDNTAIERYCKPDKQGIALLEQAAQRFDMSARAYHRILKVARTIADLRGLATVATAHISEAMTLRQLDRQSTIPIGSFRNNRRVDLDRLR